MDGKKPSYEEPWNLTKEQRLKILRQSIKDGKRIVLYFASQPDTSTFRYRCYNVFQSLLNSKGWSMVYFFEGEDEFLSYFDKTIFFVINRNTIVNEYFYNIIKKIKTINRKVFYDVDDFVINEQFMGYVFNSIGAIKPSMDTRCRFWQYAKLAEMADGFIVTNQYLKKIIEQYFCKPVFVIKNFLNKEQISSSSIFSKLGAKNKHFTIGYFSGSPSHHRDFLTIAPELTLFLKKHPDVRFLMVGFMQLPNYMRELVVNQQIILEPLTNFRDLQRKIASVHINIAPSVDNAFTNCKSELKFFEAAIVKVPTIASHVYAFENSIIHGKTGLLCNPGEWYDAFELLYNNPGKSRQITNRALDYCRNQYYGSVVQKEIEDAYDQIYAII